MPNFDHIFDIQDERSGPADALFNVFFSETEEKRQTWKVYTQHGYWL